VIGAWMSDLLILLGLLIMTVGVYGVVRFPDVYTALHALSKPAFLGVVALLLAGLTDGRPEIVARTLLIVVLLALTTPVAAHVVAQAAHHRGEPMRSPGAVDESAPTGPVPTRGGRPE
jgi:multicomponent Na+:H+ antiporter subunit G